MEIKIIFWIILGLIYLFARRKKTQAPPGQQGRVNPETEYPTESDRPKTFEELLREIEQMKNPEPEPQKYEPTVYRPIAEKYEDIEEEAVEKPVENTYYNYRDHDKIYEVYEEAKRQAFNRPSLEETVKLKDTIVRFDSNKFKQTPVHNESAELLNDLRNPKSFRKAFILSEILNRKF